MPTAKAIRSMTVSSKRSLFFLISTWVLMIPLLVFATRGGFSFEHGSENSEVGAPAGTTNDSAPMKIQSSIVYLICAFFIMRFSREIFDDFRKDMLISSLPVLAFLSTIWSQIPSASFSHAIMLCACMAFAFYLLKRFSTNDLLKLLLIVGTLAAVGSLLLIAILPRYGLQERTSATSGAWQGLFNQKIICGLMMTELLLPAFFVQIKSRYGKLFRNSYVAVLLVIIVMSRSASACIICAACIVCVATTRFLVRMPRKDSSAIIFLLAGVAAMAAILIYVNFDTLMYLIGKDPTMTGRTAIWASLIPSAMKRPLLGYGYQAFWQPLQGESAYTQALMRWPGMGYAENGVLELWLELGAVGVLLYGFVFLRAVKDAIYCLLKEPSPAVMWYTASLFFVAICNIEGGRLLATSDLDFVLSLIAVAGLRREAQSAFVGVHHIPPVSIDVLGRHSSVLANGVRGSAEAF
jgi:exopolysaccharide production protein ExoQ